LIKILWHDALVCRFTPSALIGQVHWPSVVDGAVAITAAQMGYMLEAIDWRNPQHTFRRKRLDRSVAY